MLKKLTQENFPEDYKYLRKIYLNSSNHIKWVLHYKFGFGNDPYSHSFWNAQEEWDYARFTQLLYSEFKPRSIVDLGCGSGTILSGFHSLKKNIELLGIDNSGNALNLTRERGIDIRELNIVNLKKKLIKDNIIQLGSFDIALCFEVAEHIPIWSLETFLKILTNLSNVIIFSAAQPGQGGPLHLNEQPTSYWIKKFSKMNFQYQSDTSNKIREMCAQINIPYWYINNLLIFKK